MATAEQKRRQRIRINKRAHSMGLTRRGYDYYAAGGERALAERTTSSIRKQAQREIDTAYAPVEKELSRREQEARNLSDKRAADEGAFAEWVKSEQARIASEANTRFVNLSAAEATHRKNLEQHLGVVVGQTPGAGGEQADTAQPVKSFAQSILDRQAVSGDASIARGKVGLDLLGGVQSATLGTLAQQPAKRAADLADALGKIADARGVSSAEKGQAMVKLLGGLQEQEITKAQARQAALITAGKEAQDMIELDKRLETTERGQDKTAAERAADRAQRAKDKALDRAAKRAAAKEKERAKGKRITPESRASAVQEFNKALAFLRKTEASGKPGTGLRTRNRLLRNNYSDSIATWAAFAYIYKDAPLTKQVAAARHRALLLGGK